MAMRRRESGLVDERSEATVGWTEGEVRLSQSI